MDVGFGALVLVLVLMYIFRKVITAWSAGVEDEAKLKVAEDSIPRAKRKQKVGKELEELGEVPDLDEILQKLHGSKSQS